MHHESHEGNEVKHQRLRLIFLDIILNLFYKLFMVYFPIFHLG